MTRKATLLTMAMTMALHRLRALHPTRQCCYYHISNRTAVRTLSSLPGHHQEEPTFFQRAFLGWKYMTGQIESTPREKEELQELRLAMLALHYRRLKEDVPDQSEIYYETKLAQVFKDHSSLSNVGLRHELQIELVPDILDLYDTFQKVDQLLPKVREKDILLKDYKETLREQHQYPENTFLAQKRGALEILLQHFSYTDNITTTELPWINSSSSNDDADGDHNNKEWYDLLDNFGYAGKDASDKVYHKIREIQAYNMTRSFLIKQELGYSILALKSSIPSAGRGVFVDGVAPPGSIVSFFPGKVWPREYLMNPPPALVEYFKEDGNFQLHFRGDDFLMDCRASPYTVLQNPWSVAHIANHASISKTNCRSMGINFYEQMEKDMEGLWDYLDCEYAKPPTSMGGGLLDRNAIEMHAMCLLTKRQEVSYEELFFDYRVLWQREEMPTWYEQESYELTGMNEQTTTKA